MLDDNLKVVWFGSDKAQHMSKFERKLARFSKSPALGSVLKIADIAAKVGIQVQSVGSPVADAVYEFSKAGLNQVRNYVRARDDQRVFEYHHALLARGELIDDEILEGELDEAVFHALLQACLTDIEDEKTTAYALLTRSIALGRVKQELRRHLILALRDIAWEHLDFLRKAYVITKNQIMPREGAGSVTPESFLTGYVAGSVQHLAVVNLSSKGFIDGVQLSELGLQFVEACSSDDDLTPGAYDLRIWSGHRCEVILLDQTADAIDFGQRVQACLRQKSISFGPLAMRGSLRRNEPNLYSTCVIVIYPAGTALDPSELDALRKRVGKKPVVEAAIFSGQTEANKPVVAGDTFDLAGYSELANADLLVGEVILKVNQRAKAERSHSV